MGDRLVMETDTLRDAASRIGDAAGVAGQVHSQGLVFKAEAGAAGQPDAAKGLGRFFGRWGYGAGHLETDARALAKTLGVVVDAMTQIDAKLAAAVTPTGPGAKAAP